MAFPLVAEHEIACARHNNLPWLEGINYWVVRAFGGEQAPASPAHALEPDRRAGQVVLVGSLYLHRRDLARAQRPAARDVDRAVDLESADVRDRPGGISAPAGRRNAHMKPRGPCAIMTSDTPCGVSSARRRGLLWSIRPGELVGQDCDLVDFRRFGKQVAGPDFLHQRRRYPAIEMRFAPGLVIERVEDCEGGWPLLNGEPRNRAAFGVHQGYGGTQKIGDLVLFARLRLQRDIQSKLCHCLLLC